jgi:hypothetical protein
MSSILDKPVVSIGANAFISCFFESIVIPENITSIGSSAFYNCRNLQNIIFKGTVGQWNALTKGNNWLGGANAFVTPPATYVQCSDGDVAL